MRLLGTLLLSIMILALSGCETKQPPKANASASKEYDKIQATLANLKGAQLEMVYRDHETEDARYAVWFKDKDHYKAQDGSQSYIADGETLFSVNSNTRSYERSAISEDEYSPIGSVWGFPSMESPAFKKGSATYSFIQRRGERLLRKHLEFDGDQLDVFYSLETGLPLGFRHEIASDMGDSQLIEAEYSKIKLNPALKRELFTFHKPAGYRLASDRLENIQMKVGRTFPSADLAFVDSRYRSVAQMAKENKAVLIIFWSHG